MPKHGFLTPKAIANRIKAKGLQKLRWYCQMCQKQCRDENGFKCHTMSESHQRQLLLFAESPDKYIDSFSQEFLDCFMQLLRRRFGTKRVHANQVYQEYIADRNHLHMNATEWETLTDFVKWLGREGHCVVDETEKGWFITYIDRDPETIRRQETLAKQEKMKLDDEERMAKFFQRQMERGKEKAGNVPEAVYTELKKSEEEKVTFSLKSTDRTKKAIEIKQNPLAAVKGATAEKKKKEGSSSNKRKLALEEIIEEEQRKKSSLKEMESKKKLESSDKKKYWLMPGIVVKIISKSLGDKFYNQKAVVKELENRSEAVVELIKSGETCTVYQSEVETVIPAVGRYVRILSGKYKGSVAIVRGVNMDAFSVTVSDPDGDGFHCPMKYEDVSKLYKDP